MQLSVAPLFQLSLLDQGFVLYDLYVPQAVEIGRQAYFDMVIGVTLAQFGFLHNAHANALGERNEIKSLLLRRYPAYDPIMADKAIIYFGDIDDLLIPEIRMLGYVFDLGAVEKRIVKMTDHPDKVYSTAPLKRRPVSS